MINLRRYTKISLMLCICVKAFLMNQAFAVNSWGQISDVSTQASGGLGRIMYGLSFVAGIGFLLAGLIQYKHHRDNPQLVRLSTVFTYLALGLALIALPFFAMISDSSFATK